MRDFLRILTIGVIVAGTLPVQQAAAAGASRLLPRAENPQRAQACKPKWPYVQLTCVA